ncbi:M23 family metallopeptidase [Kribbella sp. CA-293567]|uniref:M23 family metallopeptidase n=1 Tax=Kribbella sp. CA-293567 TaxID=3002436 RepID=UPI0022DD76C5|nr:M23 family metallopeptidase [Kribbella sp. CA-293567]WBQ03743.1 M23 family metallopeptidase [Kribbella sp. CA-293567]
MVPHFPGANPRKRGSIKRDDSIGAAAGPSARSARQRLRGSPHRQTVIAACCVVLSMAAGALAVVAPAQADPPDPAAKKKQLDSQITEQKTELQQSYDQVAKSVAAYTQAETRYKAVSVRYAVAQGKLAAAKAADAVAAGKLRRAEKALREAVSDVAEGERVILKQKQLAGRAAQSAYQQQNSLVGLSIVLNGASPADVANGIQVQRNVFGIQSNTITRLNNSQAQLANKRVKVAAAEKIVSAQRAEAARTVKEVAALTRQVAADKAEAATLAAAKQTTLKAAERDRNSEQAQYNALLAERGRVEQILIARAKAEKAAAAAAAAKRKAAREKAERERAKKENRPPRDVPDDPPPSNSSGLSYPIKTYITSPFGMRFHPVLHYWKLHDGTDFGAGCGTPIRAAAGGRVTDKYYNGGYGNRLFVSHGVIDGSSVTTVYNHLSKYNVSSGQRVRKGQVIGYVGTTGYSTGCHLHFMVYQDGRVVNPMKWL